MKSMVLIIGFILSALLPCHSQTSPMPGGSIEENFVGGRSEYYNVFKSKLQYPSQLKQDTIVGIVYFEIEIDTGGFIVEFKILRGVTPLMDEEVENKIYLTNGKWSPVFKKGRKVNYRIVDRVYFELR